MFQIFLRFYQFYWWHFKIIVKRYCIALEIALYKFIIIIIIIIYYYLLLLLLLLLLFLQDLQRVLNCSARLIYSTNYL